MDDERIPFQVTTGAKPYDRIHHFPVTVLLENLRSAFNVGSFFRTADAASIERLLLCGITSTPPHKGVLKTALGAEDTVPWEHRESSVEAALQYRERGYELAVIETGVHSVDLFDWQPQFPVCVIFGNELDGVAPELIALCDSFVRIPMLGLKHSLNVATAGGIVMYELLRKYRNLTRPVRCGN
ncbi:MAG TPA: RNA methyltransferase [Bryobacteraceae bacterium]|nr:RNA methyltransferase [Bryobacteraceae bacterium]